MILVRAQIDFDLWQGANNWLILGLIYTFQWPQYGQDIVVFLVFFDWLHTWVMVLLVAE